MEIMVFLGCGVVLVPWTFTDVSAECAALGLQP
jgi:hypothetical protein